MNAITAKTMVNFGYQPVTNALKAANVVDLDDHISFRKLFQFNDLPTIGQLEDRAESVLRIALENGVKQVLLSGPPFFIPYVEDVLTEAGIRVYFAYTPPHKNFALEGFVPSGINP